jgi:VCBS repeat-containing protein
MWAFASQTFALEVTNTNDAPTIGAALAAQTATEEAAFTFTVPTDAFADALSYSATLSGGSALPAWLAFDAATGTFSGTPPAAGHLALRVTATDQAGAQASQHFSLAVEAGSNQAPITAADAATLTEDRQRLAWGNVLTNDRDPEGQPLCVADAGIRRGEYGVLNLLSNGSYTYALDNCSSKVQGLGAGETVTETFRYLASDGTQRSNGALTVTVQGTNDTPTLAKPLADVQLAKKKAFTWRVPAGSFVDIDRNDTLHYTATLANGKPLPNWLTFDAATQTFSGTAPSKTKDSIEVRITVSDGHGDCSYVSDSFKIKIGGKTQSSHSSEDRDEEKEKEKKSDQECDADAWQTGPDASPHDGASRPPERSRHDDLLQRFVDDYLRPGEDSTAPPSSLDRQCLTPWSDQEHTPESGHRADSGQEMARRWAELTQALSQLDADRQGAAAWQHSDQGADLSGLTAWTHRTSRSEQGGVDSVSLGSVSGTPLVGLRGLREGLTPLTW